MTAQPSFNEELAHREAQILAFAHHAAYCARTIPAAARWVDLANAALLQDHQALDAVVAVLDGLDWPWS